MCAGQSRSRVGITPESTAGLRRDWEEAGGVALTGHLTSINTGNNKHRKPAAPQSRQALTPHAGLLRDQINVLDYKIHEGSHSYLW